MYCVGKRPVLKFNTTTTPSEDQRLPSGVICTEKRDRFMKVTDTSEELPSSPPPPQLKEKKQDFSDAPFFQETMFLP